MKRLVLAVMITLFCSLADAQVYQPISGWCQVGGQGVYAAPSGGQVPIQQYTQGSYTGCTITVYNHGTLVPATIYYTSAGVSQGNPFQANVLGFYQAFAATGLYDVQESGNINPPVSLGTVSLLDITTYNPAGGSSGQVQYNCSGLLCGSPGLTYSSGSLAISGALSAGNTSVTGTISSTGTASFPTTNVTSLADSGAASIAALATTLGGVYVGTSAGPVGAYIDFAPTSQTPSPGFTCYDAYGNVVSQPTPTNGGSFGANDVILWNSASPLQGYHAPWTIVGGANYYITGVPCTSPIPVPAGVPNGINLNAYVFANYGFASGNAAFDTVQILGGGVQAGSITGAHLYPPGTKLAPGYTPITGVTVDGSGNLSNPYGAYLGGYVQTGYSDQNPGGPSGTCTSIAVCDNPWNGGPNSIVPGLSASSPTPGTITFNTALNCEVVFNGTTWNCMNGGGGGGSPTGPLYAIQSNNPSGTFYGDAALAYAPGSPVSYVTLGNPSGGISGVYQALGTLSGFDAPICNTYNCIQAPLGGMYSLVHTSLHYTYPGSYSTTLASGPPVAPNASFTAGDISYYAGGSPCLVYYTGSTWSCIGGGSPGSPNTSVQFNNSGLFAGSANLEWNNSGQALQITGVTATAGLYVKTSYIESDQGFVAINATGGSNFNSFQAYCTGGPPCTTFVGGMAARSFTAQTYMQIGSSASTPTVTLNDTFNPGAAYFDTTSNCLKVFNNSSTWGCLASGSSSPGGANTNIQFNSSGTFGGSSNLVWTNSAHTLTIQGLTGTPGLQVNTSYITVDQGLEVTSATGGSTFNSIQAYCTGGPPCTTFVGGMAARSFTAQTYIQSGSASSTPSVTTNDSFNAGALYYNTTSNCEEVYNGSTWTCLGSASGNPASPTTSVQFNNAGVFGGSSNFEWNNSSQVLTIQGVASTLGLQVDNGYIGSDGGFTVTSSSGGGANFNSVQAYQTGGSYVGGMAANSFTAQSYIQTGFVTVVPTVTAGDTLHTGALTYSTSVGCELLYVGGGAWNCIAANGSSPSFAAVSVSGASTLTGGLTTPSGSNSQLYIGAGGSFYDFYSSTSSTSASCSGVNNGWMGVFGGDNYVVVCMSGSRYRAALVSF